jgi:TolB-like protein/Flp pilus assembly protein TadD
VLPFRNLAGNPDAAFFEFALADGVITELSGVRSLVVRPSVYVAPYVGQSVDPRRVGEELAASLVLSGGFIRTPERMRVTAQLIEAASGEILWSDRIDLLSRDLLDVQDEIAERLLAGLRLRLTAEEQERIERPLTRSPEAYEFYLRGRDALLRYVLRTHDEADLDCAVKMMHEAIGLDPEFARAHATLGRCYVLYAQGWGGAENFVLAERSLKHALAAEQGLVEARLQMAYVDLHHGDKDEARARVAELAAEQPDDPSVLFVAGTIHRLDGLYERALAAYDRVLAVSPEDVVIVAFNRARVLTHQGRFEEAVAEIDRGRAAEPEHPLLKTFLAVALFNQGMVDDAQALLEDVLRQNPTSTASSPSRLVPLRARPARAGPRPRHRPRPGDRHRRPRHRLLARVLLRDGGDDRGGARRGCAGRCGSATRTTRSSPAPRSSTACARTRASRRSSRRCAGAGRRAGGRREGLSAMRSPRACARAHPRRPVSALTALAAPLV